MPLYAERVLEEIREKSVTYPVPISTFFIGGGTPSVFPISLMEKVLGALHEHFTFLPNAECTCECNPGTVNEGFLRMLKRMGINRLSFGAQCSQPHLLQMLGRIHTWEDVISSVQLARECGFTNINLDLMLGLPGQSLEAVRETLEKALALSPAHLSCYGLIVEEGTKMHRQVEDGLWVLPDEETERQQYALCREMLFSQGFEQYEISNFARPGFRCRHNMDCWRHRPYIGIGSAACGLMGNLRWQNPPNLSDYLQGVPGQVEIIPPEEAMFETMMLGLRTMDGVKERNFFSLHGKSLESVYGEKLKKPLSEGLITWQEGVVRLTETGLSLQNRVLVELL